jgi:hypothetical protein
MRGRTCQQTRLVSTQMHLCPKFGQRMGRVDTMVNMRRAVRLGHECPPVCLDKKRQHRSICIGLLEIPSCHRGWCIGPVSARTPNPPFVPHDHAPSSDSGGRPRQNEGTNPAVIICQVCAEQMRNPGASYGFSGERTRKAVLFVLARSS